MASDERSNNSNKRRKRRWGDAAAPQANAQPPTMSAQNPADPKQKILDLKASIAAKLAAAKAKKQNLEPPKRNEAEPSQRAVKRAKTFDLDMSVTAPTFAKVTSVATTTSLSTVPTTPSLPNSTTSQKKKKHSNPYLSHLDDEETEEGVVDDSLARAAKSRKRKELTFVEPGKFTKIAETKREKAALAAASGFVSGRKTGHTIKAASFSSIYGPSSATDDKEDDPNEVKPRWDARTDSKMPLTMEWWDAELLPPALKKQVAEAESKFLSKSNQAKLKTLEVDVKEDANAEENIFIEKLRNDCFAQASLSYSKTATLVQHIVPVIPPNADTGPPKEATLYLTKKDRKRIRKLKREQRQQQDQDLQAAGLKPAPEPRLTLKNFIRVLGDQAYLDPSQMESKVAEQVRAREHAHWQRNQANKLSKEDRAAKRARKLEEDTTQGVFVALYRVKDLRHPLLRAKLDLNAQQHNVSGGVIECYNDDIDDEGEGEEAGANGQKNESIACVVLEGGPKAMKRLRRLMLVRMQWSGSADDGEDEDDDDNEESVTTRKFNPDNTCELVWEGMSTKRLFNGFVFQEVDSLGEAKTVFKNKGVAHYWDRVLNHNSGQSSMFPSIQLVESHDRVPKDDEDIVMRDE